MLDWNRFDCLKEKDSETNSSVIIFFPALSTFPQKPNRKIIEHLDVDGLSSALLLAQNPALVVAEAACCTPSRLHPTSHTHTHWDSAKHGSHGHFTIWAFLRYQSTHGFYNQLGPGSRIESDLEATGCSFGAHGFELGSVKKHSLHLRLYLHLHYTPTFIWGEAYM